MLPAFNPGTQERQVDLRSSELQDRLQNYGEILPRKSKKQNKQKTESKAKRLFNITRYGSWTIQTTYSIASVCWALSWVWNLTRRRRSGVCRPVAGGNKARLQEVCLGPGKGIAASNGMSCSPSCPSLTTASGSGSKILWLDCHWGALAWGHSLNQKNLKFPCQDSWFYCCFGYTLFFFHIQTPTDFHK